MTLKIATLDQKQQDFIKQVTGLISTNGYTVKEGIELLSLVVVTGVTAYSFSLGGGYDRVKKVLDSLFNNFIMGNLEENHKSIVGLIEEYRSAKQENR